MRALPTEHWVWTAGLAGCLALLSVVSGRSSNIALLETRIAEAEAFLQRQLEADHVTLRCTSDGSPFARLNDTGRVFGLHFITYAQRGAVSATQRRHAARLAHARREQGWAYSADAPLDSDDTAFALRALARLGRPADEDTWRVFESYRDPNTRLYRTFGSRAKATLALDPSERGNQQAHLEVNLNIAWLGDELGVDTGIPVADIVGRAQSRDGSLPSYFYPSLYYAPWLLAELTRRRPELRDALTRSQHFIRKSQHPDGGWGRSGSDAFDTGLALLALAEDTRPDDPYRRGLEYLLRTQQHDGSWQSSQVIWEFQAADSPVTRWRAYDNHRVITTAIVVAAAARFGVAPRQSAAPP